MSHNELEDDYFTCPMVTWSKLDFLHSQRCPKSHLHCVKLVQDLNEDRKTEEMCDLVVKIDGQKFPVHRVVLKASSSYFRAMFVSSFNERDKISVEIQDVSKEAFEVILNFIYGEPLRLTDKNLLEVYNCCDMLCVDNVVEECRDYLGHNWQDADDKIAAYLLAKRMELPDIMKDMIDYFCDALLTVIREPYFLEIPYEVLQEILENANQSLHEMESVLEAITAWVAHDPDSRFATFDAFISQFPLDQVPSTTVEKVVMTLIAVHVSDKVMAKKRNALVKKILSESTIIQQRLSNFNMRLVCVSTTLAVVEMCKFYCSTMEWMNSDPSIGIPVDGQVYLEDNKPKPQFKTEAIQTMLLRLDELYIFGSRTVLAHNLKTQHTRSLVPLPDTRRNFCVVPYESTMIVVGGNKPEVLLYDVLSNSWQQMGTWHHSRCSVAAFLYNDVIYMFMMAGTQRGKNIKTTSYFLSYDIRLKHSVGLSRLEKHVLNPRIAGFDNMLYVFGESVLVDSSSTGISTNFRPRIMRLCQIYNIEKKTWSDSSVKIRSSDTVLNVAAVAEGVLVLVKTDVQMGSPKITLYLYKPERDCLDYVACLPLPRELSFIFSEYILMAAK